MTQKKTIQIITLIIFSAVVILSFFFFFRIDLTADKRYSLSVQTKELMRDTEQSIKATVYLDGDLNPAFTQLKKATTELLEELSQYSKRGINIYYINPSDAETTEKRLEKYEMLQEHGISPTMVYELDNEGKRIQKAIFPWVELTYNNKTVNVNLLKNIPGNSGEENINISIENLEFEFTDAIRRLTTNKITKIAFIEGHGELSELETHDISFELSHYFQIDRGTLGTNPNILNDYKVIIIAKPTEPFSEPDKYIIDQYIMNGGRILWLIDGVKIARNNLSTSGISPAIALDINLNDILFRYGIRINPVILEDTQSTRIPINIAPANEKPQFELVPWFYSPLLLTSYAHPVTRNIREVKADFCSAIEIIENENPQLNTHLLLATSDNTHIVKTPGYINLNEIPDISDEDYFNSSYIPVAASIEGIFSSVFANRLPPKEIENPRPTKRESLPTRQIFIADGDIIRNEVFEDEALPLGFDQYMNQQFGNKDFIQNAVLYLADNDGWMDLRAKTIKLPLLNKKAIHNRKVFWQIINLAVPVILLLVSGIIYQIVRKRKYTR